jgi:GNAT superfamily N-acetyltransferase
VIVRRATVDDFPCYLELAQEFHAASPMHGVVELDEVNYRQFYLDSLANDNIGLWLAEFDGKIIGITGALAYPLYFNPTNLIVQELWWWLTPQARGSGAGKAMFETIIEWAKSKNAKAVFMIALEDDNVNKMTKLYARAGFKPIEHTYIKEVA